MSQKYGNPCATYNIPLNNSEDEVFHTGCAQLYYFLHLNGKSGECCKPMMLKMHLEIDKAPLTGETEEQYIEHNYSNNCVLESVQQLEARIKTLEDALLQTKWNENKLIDSIGMLERSKAFDQVPDGGNNITQDSNASKETNNVSNLSGDEQHNDTENVAGASGEHNTCPVSEERQEVLDLRHKCVYVQNIQCSDSSLDRAFCNIRKLAIEMKAQIADHSVVHIDVDVKKENYLDYYVYFRDAGSKIEFLRNRFIFKYNPNTGYLLRILDYSRCGIVDIKNFQSTDLSMETAVVNVSTLMKNMRMKYIKNYIDHIDVYSSTESNFLTYSVRFNREDMKNAFLQKKDILKQFPETRFLEISDVGGHTLSCNNVNNFSIAIASANVIGLAEIMSLSLSTDNIKRIYVLNTKIFGSHTNRIRLALIVDFASKPIKDEFLKKKYKLEQIENINRYSIKISEIETEGNVIMIKYGKFWSNDLIAISFIGLAKQMVLSLTCHQINCFIKLLDFTYKACTPSTHDL